MKKLADELEAIGYVRGISIDVLQQSDRATISRAVAALRAIAERCSTVTRKNSVTALAEDCEWLATEGVGP